MKILITTPTGRIGGQIIQDLLAPEFTVRVLTPEPARIPEEIREQVEMVRGLHDDTETLRRALEGVEALFWCVPGASDQNVREHYERFARAGARAIAEARTARLVTISALGGGHTGTFAALRAMEEILNESGAAIRHLRCGVFMEHLLPQARSIGQRGFIYHPTSGEERIPWVAMWDVVDLALKRLVRRDWSGVASELVRGAEDVSFNQMAAILERVLECPVQSHAVSAGDFVRALVQGGAELEQARSIAELLAEMADENAGESDNHGRGTATSLSAWAADELLSLSRRFRRESMNAGSCHSMCVA